MQHTIYWLSNNTHILACSLHCESKKYEFGYLSINHNKSTTNGIADGIRMVNRLHGECLSRWWSGNNEIVRIITALEWEHDETV